MSDRVVERFLRNPEKRCLDDRFGPRCAVECKFDLKPLMACFMSKLTKRRDQPEIIEDRRTHSCNHPAQFLHQRTSLIGGCQKINRIAITCQFQPSHQRSRRLRDTIMKFMGNAAALGFLYAQQFSEKARQPRLARPRRKACTDQLTQQGKRLVVFAAWLAAPVRQHQPARTTLPPSGCRQG